MNVWRDGTSGSASSALTPSSCLWHYLGMAGHPRRYSELTEVGYLHNLLPLQKFITYVAFITIAGQFIFLFNLFWSMKFGKKASDNPWEATTLEWTTATPLRMTTSPVAHPLSITGLTNTVCRASPRDFVMQTDPLTVAVR